MTASTLPIDFWALQLPSMALHSPFSHLLQMNYSPSTEEVPRIIATIREQEAIMQDLDLELEEVHRAIEKLQEREREIKGERRRHKKFADQHQAMLTPVRALPLDILSQIFTAAIPSIAETRLNMSRQLEWQRHPIIRISHVCHEWRTFAISLRTLWTVIGVYVHPPPYPGDRKQWPEAGRPRVMRNFSNKMNIVTMFISRAGGCPLTILLSAEEPDLERIAPFEKAIVPLLDTLREGIWEDVEFSLVIRHSRSSLLHLLDLPAHSQATLRRARLQLCTAEHPLDISEMILKRLKLNDATNLSSFCVDVPGKQLLDVKLHWASLTELEIGIDDRDRYYSGHDNYDLDASHAYEILRRSPNLVRCELRLHQHTRCDLSTPDHFPARLTLSRLRTLVMWGFSPPPQFGSSLVLPSLRTLSILHDTTLSIDRYEAEETPWTGDQSTSIICGLVDRYGGNLTDVTFDYGSLTQSALIHCLELLPNVVSFRVEALTAADCGDYSQDEWGDRAVFDQTVLSRLTPVYKSGAKPCLCPKLECFVCLLGPVEENYDDWKDLVTARRRDPPIANVSYLKRAHVEFNSIADDSSGAKGLVKKLASRGVPLDGLYFTHVRVRRFEPNDSE